MSTSSLDLEDHEAVAGVVVDPNKTKRSTCWNSFVVADRLFRNVVISECVSFSITRQQAKDIQSINPMRSV